MSFEPGDKVVCIRGNKNAYGYMRLKKGVVYTVKDFLGGAGLVEVEEIKGRLWYEKRFEKAVSNG